MENFNSNINNICNSINLPFIATNITSIQHKPSYLISTKLIPGKSYSSKLNYLNNILTQLNLSKQIIICEAHRHISDNKFNHFFNLTTK